MKVLTEFRTKLSWLVQLREEMYSPDGLNRASRERAFVDGIEAPMLMQLRFMDQTVEMWEQAVREHLDDL